MRIQREEIFLLFNELKIEIGVMNPNIKIKRHLLLERKAMTNLDSILQRHYFAKKGPYSQSYGFPVVMYGCDNKEG